SAASGGLFPRRRCLLVASAAATTVAARATTTATAAAVTAAAAAGTAPTTARPAAAAAAIGLGPRLVDRQCPPTRVLPVEGGDGGLCFGVTAHLDEAEALRAARVAVHDHLCRLYRAVRLEELHQVAVGHRIIQVADIQFLTHSQRSLKDDPPPSG